MSMWVQTACMYNSLLLLPASVPPLEELQAMQISDTASYHGELASLKEGRHSLSAAVEKISFTTLLLPGFSTSCWSSIFQCRSVTLPMLCERVVSSPTAMMLFHHDAHLWDLALEDCQVLMKVCHTANVYKSAADKLCHLRLQMLFRHGEDPMLQCWSYDSIEPHCSKCISYKCFL